MASDATNGGPWERVVRLADGQHVVEAREVPTCIGVISWLSIRRTDGTEIQSWDELQRVKNEIAGPERLAVEFYPPQANVINLENLRHLWVLPPGWVAPFGMALGPVPS